MELTQSDYDERVARVAAGSGTDEDARLIKLYENEGFSGREDSVGKRGADENGATPPTVTVPDEQPATEQQPGRGAGTAGGKQSSRGGKQSGAAGL